jgi:pyridoxal 5'-phosphate synthase pdxT subunit
MKAGVLALQGDFREHAAVLASLGAAPIEVRTAEDLARVDALVIPGGESTTISKLARSADLVEPIRERARDGMPMLGTCAGMIVMAARVDGLEPLLGLVDVTVRRNAYGRQVDSFETDVDFEPFDSPFHALFIRAPWVEKVGAGVEVLATIARGPAAGRIVAVRQGPLMATSFHPEITADDRVHRYFVGLVRSGGAGDASVAEARS